MRTEAIFCDLCIHDNGTLRLAGGFYITDEGLDLDACSTHLEEVKKYKFEIYEFKTLGDIDESLI